MAFTVDLSVGHGRKPDGTYDPGAVTADGQTSEQSAGDVVVRAMAARLRTYDGIKVTAVEDYADDPNYAGSVNRVNRTRPDLALSLHHDWRGAPDGFFCHWYEGSSAQHYADAMFAAVADAPGYQTRPGWHKPKSLYFVRETAVPAVLIECGRIGEYTDLELKRLGRILADAVAAKAGYADPSDTDSGGSGMEYTHTKQLVPVREGHKGPGVTVLQALLKSLGRTLKADGHYGPNTVEQLDAVVGADGTVFGPWQFVTVLKRLMRRIATRVARNEVAGHSRSEPHEEASSGTGAHDHEGTYAPVQHEHEVTGRAV